MSVDWRALSIRVPHLYTRPFHFSQHKSHFLREFFPIPKFTRVIRKRTIQGRNLPHQIASEALALLACFPMIHLRTVFVFVAAAAVRLLYFHPHFSILISHVWNTLWEAPVIFAQKKKLSGVNNQSYLAAGMVVVLGNYSIPVLNYITHYFCWNALHSWNPTLLHSAHSTSIQPRWIWRSKSFCSHKKLIIN